MNADESTTRSADSTTVSSLLSVVDAIHGAIDISDPVPQLEVIPRLLVSPPLQRLRRVKQLDFASQTYSAADHSRYAHALGTMQVMRQILGRLSRVHDGLTGILDALHVAYPEVFSTDVDHSRKLLMQHMLVAGLLQDIGELPYAHATKHLYQPSNTLRDTVARTTGLDVGRLSTKTIFTLGLFNSDIVAEVLDQLHLPFLVHLLANQAAVAGQAEQPEVARALRPLRHILDGTVDADRLDYVFRDAHHTVGGFGSPGSVIETLLYYDDVGPVVNAPGPVANLLATRAYLYSTVYHSPSNRFRIHVLLTLLRGVLRDSECSRAFFGTSGTHLSIEDLLDLDDVSVAASITDLANSTRKRSLDTRTRNALEILSGRYAEYEYFWLPPNSARSPASSKALTLPTDVFFDTYRDQEGPIYQPSSVRVAADSLRYIGPVLPLEVCGGPFSALFRDYWSMVPMRDSILVFVPRRPKGLEWESFQSALAEGWLYDALIEEDPLGPSDFPTDTRTERGHTGPCIFISFSWQDLAVVRSIANALALRKRRYHLYLRPFQGIGSTPSDNSIRSIENAEAILLVASTNYANRLRDEPDGYISRELFAMSNRVAKEQVPIVVVAADNARDLKDALPWSALGFPEPPFTGKSLRSAAPSEFREAIDEVLATIDKQIKQRTGSAESSKDEKNA